MAFFTAALAASLSIVAARVGGAGSRQAALAAAPRGYGAAAKLPGMCGLLDNEPGKLMLHAGTRGDLKTGRLTEVGAGAFGKVRRSPASCVSGKKSFSSFPSLTFPLPPGVRGSSLIKRQKRQTKSFYVWHCEDLRRRSTRKDGACSRRLVVLAHVAVQRWHAGHNLPRASTENASCATPAHARMHARSFPRRRPSALFCRAPAAACTTQIQASSSRCGCR